MKLASALICLFCSAPAFAIPCTVTKTWNSVVPTQIGTRVDHSSQVVDRFEVSERRPHDARMVDEVEVISIVGTYGSVSLELRQGKIRTQTEGNLEQGAHLTLLNGADTAVDFTAYNVSCQPERAF